MGGVRVQLMTAPHVQGHPDLIAFDGGVEIAAAVVLLDEGVEVVEQRHGQTVPGGRWCDFFSIDARRTPVCASWNGLNILSIIQTLKPITTNHGMITKS